MIMTVAHLTSELSGGAGVAAQRLHDAVRRQGVDSRLYYESGLPLVGGCQRVLENQSFTRRNLAALAQAWRNRRNAPGCLVTSPRWIPSNPAARFWAAPRCGELALDFALD